MGDAVDKLIALAGTEHVKAYTKADGTHVAAHTRVGGRFRVKLPSGEYQTRNSKTHDYTHAVMVKHKTSGEDFVYRWSGSPKAAEAGRKEAAKYGFTESKIVPVERDEDGSQKVWKQQIKDAQASTAKAPDKPAQSAVEALKAKVEAPKEGATPEKSVRYDAGRKHPKPEYAVGDDSPRGKISDRKLMKYSDGTYHWEYSVASDRWNYIKAHQM